MGSCRHRWLKMLAVWPFGKRHYLDVLNHPTLLFQVMREKVTHGQFLKGQQVSTFYLVVKMIFFFQKAFSSVSSLNDCDFFTSLEFLCSYCLGRWIWGPSVHKWRHPFFEIFDPFFPIVTHFNKKAYGVTSPFGRSSPPP